MNGAQAPTKTDFGPLQGRRVLIWPDADAPGAAYAAKVAELARAAGAASVSRSWTWRPWPGTRRPASPGSCRKVGTRRTPWRTAGPPRPSRRRPGGGRSPYAPDSTSSDPSDAARRPSFRTPSSFKPGGVYYRTPREAPRAAATITRPFGSARRFRVLAVTRDQAGGEFGRLVAFRDLDGATSGER